MNWNPGFRIIQVSVIFFTLIQYYIFPIFSCRRCDVFQHLREYGVFLVFDIAIVNEWIRYRSSQLIKELQDLGPEVSRQMLMEQW